MKSRARVCLEDYYLKRCKENMDKLVMALYENSGAHGIEHIETVLRDAVIIKGSELDVEEELAIVFHDSGNHINRKTHHILSSEIFRREADGLYDKTTIDRICSAIEKHRGSFKGEFNNKLEELVSAADRGKPDSLEYTVMRSYKYAIEEQGCSRIDAAVNAHAFVKNKYSRNGYANYPQMYIDYYGVALDKFHESVENLTMRDVLMIVTGGDK